MFKFILILIFALFLSGCAFTDFSIHQIIYGCTKELSYCENGRSVGRVGPNCEFAPCELPSSLEECETKQGFWKDWCISDFASEVTINPEICKTITSNRVKNECFYNISYNDNAKDADTCMKLPIFQNDCIVNVSENSSDEKLCDLVAGKDKAECFKNVGRNTLRPELCDKSAGYYYGSFEFNYLCMRDIAIKTNDRSFCSKQTKEFYRTDCESGFSQIN
ncbi:MAG: hypothetical protein HY392_00810 [Candidatus Diapherotrites archaeon]|nr:hypothetical protein [Candidatus Diapherotrites archaeon]